MADRKLRQAIAAEAARLLQQRKESDYHVARRKAARWYSRQRVSPDDLPSYGEIQQEVFALAGLFSAERQHSAVNEIRLTARELLVLLSPFQPCVAESAIRGPILPGSQIELVLNRGDKSDVCAVLFDAGFKVQSAPDGRVTFFHRFPCLVAFRDEANTVEPRASETLLVLDQLDALMAVASVTEQDEQSIVDADDDEPEDSEDYHPDFFPTLAFLLNSLESIRLDPIAHPEGDLLYHSLQVYELGLAERPYDEEFLLACLLHDVGMGLDRRRPLEATWQALGGLITPRTWFFIENLAEAIEYLSTGRIRGALKRSQDFEELVLLARCDQQGRRRGARVSTVEEALDYLAGLSTAWDES